MKRRSGSYNRPWRSAPPFVLTHILQCLLMAQGSVSQAVQQWEEAHRAFEKTVAVAQGGDFRHFARIRPLATVPALCRGRGVGRRLPLCVAGHRRAQAH